jgi:hypothetical protein
MLVRTRTASALGAIRTDETRQLRLRLAIPDAVGTSSRFLMAHRLDVGSVAADKLATRFLRATRPSAIRRTATRRRLESSTIIPWTPRSPTRPWRAVEPRSLRPWTVRRRTLCTRLVRLRAVGTWTVRRRTLYTRLVRLRAVGTRAIRLLTLGTGAAGMRPVVSGPCALRETPLAGGTMMLAVPHPPFLPTTVRPLAAVRSFLIGCGHRRRRCPAHFMALLFRPAAPVSVVLSLRRYVKHPEAVRVFASQSRFVQERQQSCVSSQLETSCIAMHGRVLERDDGQMRRMVETTDTETIARCLLLRPGIVLAHGII